MKTLLLLLLAGLLLPLSAPCADEPLKHEPAGMVSPAARPLIQKAVQAAGGKTNLLGFFAFKDNVRLGEKDTGFGAKRESVMDAPHHWWLKAPGSYSEREDEPATFVVWAWTLGALTSPASTVEIVPDVKDGDMELWGLRVSGSVKPAMELYFSKTNDLLARIDWRSDIHRFSAWTTLPTGTKYPARAVGYKKDTGKTWYYDDVTEVTPLQELPEKLQPVQPAPPTTADQAKTSEPKDQEFRRIMDAGDVPGLSIVRILNSRVAWSRQFGRQAAMNAAVNATPIDRGTVFEAASLGKPVVAIAALWLHDRGRLGLDEPAETIVPYPMLDDSRKTSLTPRMLMSHTSGLAFGQPKLEAEPGSRYRYSTEGYRHLQRIVEKRLGEPLELWAQRTLFGPLQMDRSSFTFTERFAANRATGRNWLDRGQEYMTNAAGTGAFDLITTADDYARLWADVLRGEVLSSESLRLMFTPQKPITSTSHDPTVPKTESVDLAAGLGLLLQREGPSWLGFQWGDNGGTTGFLIVDSVHRDAVVFLSNAQDGLHAGQAIVAGAGMPDNAIGWLGYTAFDTPARAAWKRITGRLNVDRMAGLAEYERLLAKDRATVAPLSRNLGYYNKFRGFVIEAEPFFRGAVGQNTNDADLYEVWAESLQAGGRIEAAAEAQERAIDLDASRVGSLKLPEWVRSAKRDLAHPAAPDHDASKSHAGLYGDLSFEISAAADFTVVQNARRRGLIRVRSGEYLASDLTSRFIFAPSGVTVIDAGMDPIVLSRKSAQ